MHKEARYGHLLKCTALLSNTKMQRGVLRCLDTLEATALQAYLLILAMVT